MATALAERVRAALSFRRLEVASFAHSAVYLCLLGVAGLVNFADVHGLGEALFALGLTHGLGWIAMSVCALMALRLGVIGLRLAVAVAVIGAIGPFVGSWEFVRESRRRRLDGS